MKDIIWAFVAHLINAIRYFAPGIVGRTLTALGIGLYVYKVAYPPVLAYVQSQVAGLPGVLIQYFGALGLDVVVTIWLSATITKLVTKSKFGSILNNSPGER